MTPAATYTANEALLAGAEKIGKETIIRGHPYIWLNEYSVYMLLTKPRVVLTAKRVTKKVMSRLHQEDFKHLTAKRYRNSFNHLSELVNPLNKSLVKSEAIKDWFKNKLGE